MCVLKCLTSNALHPDGKFVNAAIALMKWMPKKIKDNIY